MIETVEGDILFPVKEDYHILSMETYCVIESGKHKIRTTVDYVKEQKHYRKIFENILEENKNADRK